jgi:iron complex outermembrane receptor protein
MNSKLEVLVCVLALALALGLALTRVAAAAELNAESSQIYDIEIPSQNAADALNRLAEQTGAVMLFPYDLAKSRDAQPVYGRYSVMDALAKLLEGSGLSSGLSERSVIQITVDTTASGSDDEGKETMKAPTRRNRLLGLIGLAASAAATQSQAQETVQPAFGVEEVIVSSRRREESLQQTPISVSAQTGEQLMSMGVRNMIELGNFMPNVMTEGSGIGPSVGAYFLRGIGSARSGIEDEPPVGLYLDGVFLGSFDGSLLQVTKPKRVEVLRGPQGTLFGKNALGGAVQYISQEPVFEEFSGEIETTYGSFNRTDLTALFNIPLGDSSALRVSGASFNRDGTVTRPLLPKAADVGTDYLRVDYLWAATPDFSVRLAVDYAAVNTNGAGNVIRSVDLTDTNVQRYLARGMDLRESLFDDRYASNASSPTYVDSDQTGVALTLDYQLADEWSVKSITAYRENNQDSWIDRDATPFQYFEQIDMRAHQQTTQEFQLSFSGDSLTWILGLYYFDESPFNNRQRLEGVDIGSGILHEVFSESNQSSAIYSEGTYQFNDLLSLTLGARYTYERKWTSTLSSREGDPTPPLYVSNNADFEAFSPRIVLQAQWTPDLMTYASYSDGFKSGGFNTRYNPTLPDNGFIPYAEEYLDNYELGLRSEWFDNRLRLNASVFHSIYTDRQITQLTDLNTLLVSNGGEAEFDGVEIEGQFLVTRNLLINFGAGHVKSEITEVGIGSSEVLGESIGNTPEWSYNIDAEYGHDLASGGKLTYRLSYGWKDEREIGVENNNTVQPAYGMINGRIEYSDPENRWRLALFGTNLGDESYLVQSQTSRGIGMAVYNDPREYGVAFTYSF